MWLPATGHPPITKPSAMQKVARGVRVFAILCRCLGVRRTCGLPPSWALLNGTCVPAPALPRPRPAATPRVRRTRFRVRGAQPEKATGKIKEGVGRASDDDKLTNEGRGDQAKGDLHEAAGKVKDAAGKARDAANR